MRNILCILISAFVLAAVHATTEEERMQIGLATLFDISLKETESCLQQTGVGPNDLILLERVATGKKTDSIDKGSLRRASCTVTCLANAQGTMSGAKIQVSKARDVIKKSQIPQEDKGTVLDAISFCYDQVQHITDECNVGLEFIKCLVAQVRELDI